MSRFTVAFAALVLAVTIMLSSAFVVVHPTSVQSTRTPTTTTNTLFLFNKNKEDEEDLSFIETRDMTREEMELFNKRSEDIMQGELWGMTLFSLVISIPMLYLVWVGFFSETAEMNL